MENMTINIHFFRSNQLGRLSFETLRDYFINKEGFKITFDDNEVNFIYTDKEFNFQYMYKITRISQVRDIYKLDPGYLNINFMLCLPILIPSYIAKEIINFAQVVAKTFDLYVYHNSYKDLKPFNAPDLYSIFFDSQKEYLEKNDVYGKVYYDSKKLSAICKYQKTLDNSKEYFHHDVQVDPCKPIIDYKSNEFGICTVWNAGIPTLFAPFFDYVLIKEEDGESFYIRRGDFMKYMEKFITKAENTFPDSYVLRPKQAKKSKSVLTKLKRSAMVDSNFHELQICDLLDRY